MHSPEPVFRNDARGIDSLAVLTWEGVAMVARVARFKGQPDRFVSGKYRWVLDAIRSVDGFEAAYHLVDGDAGDSVSISIFANRESAVEAERAVNAARERLGLDASPPDAVQTWRVVDSTRR